MPEGKSTYIPTIHATPKGRELLLRTSGHLMGRRKWIMLVVTYNNQAPPNIVELFRRVRQERKVNVPEATLARELTELERSGLVRIAR